jgi:hypothetical protein
MGTTPMRRVAIYGKGGNWHVRRHPEPEGGLGGTGNPAYLFCPPGQYGAARGDTPLENIKYKGAEYERTIDLYRT